MDLQTAYRLSWAAEYGGSPLSPELANRVGAALSIAAKHEVFVAQPGMVVDFEKKVVKQ